MSWQSRIAPLAEAALHNRAVPGLVLAVARGHDVPEYLVLGTDAAGRALTTDSLFPVASITKLATALAVLRLVADGMLELDDPLAKHLPDAAAAQDGVTLRTMLSHTAGLPIDLAPEAAPYAPGLDWPALVRACLATPPAAAPLIEVQYSNVGSGLLAIVVERRTGLPIREALETHVLSPLGIEGTLGSEPPRPPAVLTGELGDHAGTALEPFNSPFWRSLGMPWGGLLTTAAGALALVRAYAGVPAGFLPADILADATRDQTGGLGGGLFGSLRWPRCPWGLGAELRGDKAPHWTPAEASPDSFGHVGASGCLAWCDPAADVAWAILGTRTFERWWRAWPSIGAAVLATGGPAGSVSA
ncbi:MAG: beta-lactamase family protein [Ardenticatenales bacterium]|nr:beta-lactamase family protein [Ardenticatenales bacterium]